MSTLSEQTGDRNPPDTGRQPADTKEEIDGLLRQFDALPSKWERVIFKYISVYLIGLFFLARLFFFLDLSITSPFPLGELLVGFGLDGLIVLVFLSVLWRFNVWRVRAPKILGDLIEKQRIFVSGGDDNTTYLRFLEHYREVLASPKRYLLSAFPMILSGIFFTIFMVQFLTDAHLNSVLKILGAAGLLASAFLYLGGLYCLGIVIWAIHISGRYVRKLVRTFEFSIQPLHTDQCGGLKLLGNFCFGLISPLLIGSGLIIGYLLLYLHNITIETDAVLQTLELGLVLLFLVLYFLAPAIFACFLPLRDIHTKMVSEGERDEATYNARIEALREEIQALLESNQVEEAKVVQEIKAVWERLHAPYPTWPFRVRSKLFTTVLGASGSLLLGLLAAALEQYFLPALFSHLFHTP